MPFRTFRVLSGMRPALIFQAAVFYGAMLLIAALWNGLRGRGIFIPGGSIFADVLVGLLAAAATIASGLICYRFIPALRRIAGELGPILIDGSRRRDLVLVSIFSGVGEEALFRGAVQPEFGIFWTALLFGALHVGPGLRYLVWTAWATGAGLLFGILYAVTGGLVAPIVAHAVHNAATLLIWKRHRENSGAGDSGMEGSNGS